MTLSRGKFDGVWSLAALLAGVSVLSSDHVLRFLPISLVPFTLGGSLLLAVFLSLFVKRGSPSVAKEVQISSISASAFQQSSEEVAMGVKVQPAISHTRAEDSYVHSLAAYKLYVAQRASLASAQNDETAVANRSFAIYLRRHTASLKFTEPQLGTLTQLVGEQQVTRRRNVLAEAVEIAKKIKGTGLEVAVAPDNCILLRHRESSERLGVWGVPLESPDLAGQTSLPN